MGSDSDAWTFQAAVVTAVLAALIQLPIGMLADRLLEWSAEEEYEWRYPAMTAEVEGRKAAAVRLRKLTLAQLEARVARLQELQEELGFLPARTALTSQSTTKGTATGGRSTAPTRRKGKKTRDDLIGLDLDALKDSVIDTESIALGWRDAPPDCIAWCGLVLSGCGRHPRQKRAWVLAKLHVLQRRAIKKAAKRSGKASKAAEMQEPPAAPPSEGSDVGVPGAPAPAAQPRAGMLSAAARAASTRVLAGVQAGVASAALAGQGAPNLSSDNDDNDEAGGEGSLEGLDAFLEELAGAGDLGEALSAILIFFTQVVILSWVVGSIAAAQTALFNCLGMSRGEQRPANDQQQTGAQPQGAAAAATSMGEGGAVKDVEDEHSLAVLAANNPVLRRVLETLQADTGSNNKAAPGTSKDHVDEEWIIDDDDTDGSSPPKDWARRLGCAFGSFTLYRTAVIVAWTAWVLYYVLLFGLWQSKEVLEAQLLDFAASQFFSLAVIIPLLTLGGVLWSFAVWPAWLPYLAWIPKVGRVFLGPHAAVAGAAPDASLQPTVLSGRLVNVTFVRAAGAASMLSPDAAVLAYGVTGVVTGLLNGVANRVTGSGTAAARPAADDSDGAAAAAEEEEDSPSSLLRYKQELAVQCYTLERLLLSQAHSEKAKAVAMERVAAEAAQV